MCELRPSQQVVGVICWMRIRHAEAVKIENGDGGRASREAAIFGEALTLQNDSGDNHSHVRVRTNSPEMDMYNVN